MDAADVESAEVIEVGNTGRVDHFYSCGQRRPKWNGEVPEMSTEMSTEMNVI